MLEPIPGAWDFSAEKSRPVFATSNNIQLRPITGSDVDFYIDIRMQYSMMVRASIGTETHTKEGLFLAYACQPESFFCIIEDPEKQTPIGYLGIKDTRSDMWELAIELDKQYTHQGYGSQSIKLFLNEVSRITGKNEFRATIEPDNIASQGCFEKLGAELIGLSNTGLVRTPEDQKRFEDKHLHLIDDHIRAVAARLGVEPRKLLSNILEYRITCPISDKL